MREEKRKGGEEDGEGVRKGVREEERKGGRGRWRGSEGGGKERRNGVRDDHDSYSNS